MTSTLAQDVQHVQSQKWRCKQFDSCQCCVARLGQCDKWSISEGGSPQDDSLVRAARKGRRWRGEGLSCANNSTMDSLLQSLPDCKVAKAPDGFWFQREQGCMHSERMGGLCFCSRLFSRSTPRMRNTSCNMWGSTDSSRTWIRKAVRNHESPRKTHAYKISLTSFTSVTVKESAVVTSWAGSVEREGASPYRP
jgi:hypothetical protein